MVLDEAAVSRTGSRVRALEYESYHGSEILRLVLYEELVYPAPCLNKGSGATHCCNHVASEPTSS